MLDQKINITECPRDAMQGWPHQIDTEIKIDYLSKLLEVGFDVLDFGSFVNPKVMPQMADTVEVLKSIESKKGSTKLLSIIANLKGAQQAVEHEHIDILGFPFSISETFQLRNTNKTIEASFDQVKEIQQIASTAGKKVLIYISMGFGNPYGDPYSPKYVEEWINKLAEVGIQDFALSDTIGVSHPELISEIFNALNHQMEELNIGAHFHSTPSTALEKINVAYSAGCRLFDTSINGIGGCPMAADELTGNLSTESLLDFMSMNEIPHGLNLNAFLEAQSMAGKVFSIHN